MSNTQNQIVTVLVCIGGMLAIGVSMICPAHELLRSKPTPESFAAGHSAADRITQTAVQQNRLYAKIKQWRHDRQTITEAVGDEHLLGRWDGPYDWPVVAIHATLLPDGKVLAFDSINDGPSSPYPAQQFTRATLWDPQTNTHVRVDSDTGYNLFCSAHTLLSDGQVFIAGGNLNSSGVGLDKTHTFDPVTRQWKLENTLSEGGRWYPSATALPQGEVLITGGGPSIPELRLPGGALMTLDNADSSISADLNVYHWLRIAPNGDVVYLGPYSQMQRLSNVYTGGWETFAERDQKFLDYGSFAMYDIGKVLIAGGSFHNKQALLVNLKTNRVKSLQAMNYERRQHNLTILADGSVLATGGMQNSDEILFDLDNGVYAAERWDPITRQWKVLASMLVTRQYHSSALLLPDGRVLSAGGGICATCEQKNYLNRDAEIFSPPYLFKKDGSGALAGRPKISQAPDALRYGNTFEILTPRPWNISKVALVRFGGVTHSTNFDQQYVPLTYTLAPDRLLVNSPANGNIAPPGYYMLFILNAKGTPSVAKILVLRST